MFVRYIYAYRWKETGKVLYVGSAWDPEKRDHIHSNSDGIPFDRYIQKCGRDKLTFEIVEAVRGSTKTDAMNAAAPRENFWMDEFKTYRTPGCFNFGRGGYPYASEEAREAWVAALSAAAKGIPKSIAATIANSIGHKGIPLSPEHRAAIGNGQRGIPKNPEHRATISATMKGILKSAEHRAAISAAKKGIIPSASNRAALNTPEVRARISAAHSGVPLSAEHRAALRLAWARRKTIQAERKMA